MNWKTRHRTTRHGSLPERSRWPWRLCGARVLLAGAAACLSACRGTAVEPEPVRPASPELAALAAPVFAEPGGGTAGALDLGDPYFPGLGNGGYDVEHYDLVLDLDLATNQVRARAKLRARTLHALASFSLDLYGLEVERVLVDGEPARFERPAPVPATDAQGRAAPSELVIHPAEALASGAEFEVEVGYRGEPVERPDASVAAVLPGTGWMRTGSGVYVVSECIGASSWFPCNDHPRDKATYSFRVTVAKPYVVAANGLLLEVLEQGERRTYVFRASNPMASYLATVNVAEFAAFEERGPGGIPVRTYHPLDATAEELASFRRQPEVLEFLVSLFGAYPFESAGAVLSYENFGGALECQTLPVYARDSGQDEVIVHELAHQWFGDCVSPDLWRDMWLNEGFATYAEWLWAERQGGSEQYERCARTAYRSLRNNRTESPHDPGVAHVFGTRVYKRGALVLHGLRREVGDEAFFRVLRTWVAAHRDGNASTADFVRHASENAGRDLRPFFDAWLFSELTPEVPAFESPDEGEKPRPDASGEQPRGGG